MTMRRTRHKLEPQCDQSIMYARNCATDEDKTNKQAQGTHESVVVLVSVYMLRVCGHVKHVVVLVALH